MASSYRNEFSKSKANLKLVKSPTATLRLGGLAPGPNMNPGEYTAVCETAWVEVGKSTRIVWQFRIVAGEHTGVSLRKWLVPADRSGQVSPFGNYAKYCEIALGRPLQVADDMNYPGAIFGGHIFKVFVGYRKTLQPKGGMFSDKNAFIRKDEKDQLRVHDILARVEL